MSPRAHLYLLRIRRHTSLPSFLQAGSWARATRTATDKPKPPRTNRERGHTGTMGAEAELEQSPASLFSLFCYTRLRSANAVHLSFELTTNQV